MKHTIWLTVVLLLALVATGCVAIPPQDSKVNTGSYHYQMGRSYLGERNYTSALIELTEAEKSDPDNPELLYHLGQAYVGKKRYDLAEPKFLRAVMLKPGYSLARNDLGVAYLELKRWDNAVQQFKIVKDDLFYDNSENATINLGLAYLGKGDYPLALQELRTIGATNPRNPIIRLSLGRVLFAMDKPDQAVVEYRKALEIYKDFGAAYYHLGLAHMKQNKIEDASKAFKEVIRIIPDSELGISAQGYLDLLK